MNKLYETQSYLKENNTIITKCISHDKGYLINLQDSILFPNEGGQYADTGKIVLSDGTEVRIRDGQVNGDTVDYYIDQMIEEGSECTVYLDWDKRYMRMQQHSGEHIISGLLHKIYGLNNVGFHLSDDDYITVDLNKTITPEVISEIELKANQVVYSNLPIIDSYPAKNELKNIDYRSKIEINGQVRLITIGTDENIVDICACCAPHVKSTGEIGLIKVFGFMNYKGGTRLQILCGLRAFKELTNEHNILKRMALDFSTSVSNVEVSVNDLKTQLNDANSKLSSIIENDLLSQISNMDNNDIPCIFLNEIHGKYMKSAYNAMCDKFENRYVGVFIGNDSLGYRYFAGNSHMDSLVLKSIMMDKLDAKGGGTAEMIQGKVNCTAKEIVEIFR